MNAISSLICDTHVHVFDPQQFPYQARRAYTPPPALIPALVAEHRALGVGRVVLVQPSVYGTDNSCLLHALSVLGSERARGVAVVDLHATNPAQLWALHAAGVRGVRLNVQVQGGALTDTRAQIEQAGRLLRPLGWSLQVHAALPVLMAVLDVLQDIKIPIVLDHYAGGLDPLSIQHRHQDRLLVALARYPFYVKLSAPYRLWVGDAQGRAHDLAHDLAQAYTQAAPDRVLWGSDWPHTGGSGARGGSSPAVEPFRQVDNTQVLQALLACMPDDAQRQRLLVHNPAALYGFAA